MAEEQDVTNFSSSSSHRLPTISASEEVQIANARAGGIPTGLAGLDTLLSPPAPAKAGDDGSGGGGGSSSRSRSRTAQGLPCGYVTEIYGPPGVGKTAFAMQVVANTIVSAREQIHRQQRGGGVVVWIDTGTPLPGGRLRQILAEAAASSSSLGGKEEGEEKGEEQSEASSTVDIDAALESSLEYFHLPALAHLLTLFIHPTAKFPPPRTRLIVVDNVSSLFAAAFPRPPDEENGEKDRPAGAANFSADAAAARNKSMLQKKVANRKWAVAGDLAAAMAKMASLRHIAILVVNQVATSMRGVGGGGGFRSRAVLKPALSGRDWDTGIACRILLYRDFAPRGGAGQVVVVSAEQSKRLRFAKVLKATITADLSDGGGGVGSLVVDQSIAFVIEDTGLREIKIYSSSSSTGNQPAASVAVQEQQHQHQHQHQHDEHQQQQRRPKRKVDEIADSEEDSSEEVEIGSNHDDDDFGLPDDDVDNDIFQVVLDVAARGGDGGGGLEPDLPALPTP